MASLKVLIDAQCLLIKKLLSLTTLAVCRDRHTLQLEDDHRGGGKKKHHDNNNNNDDDDSDDDDGERGSILTENKIKRQVVFAHSLALHAKWQTKPRVWRSEAAWLVQRKRDGAEPKLERMLLTLHSRRGFEVVLPFFCFSFLPCGHFL